jgi:murein DD-endopeptidase MepM/ murein hydrolase activator NlpD
MIKPKSKMIEPSSEAAASEVFAIADTIIPIRQASVETILNTDFTEEMEVVPHTQVKRLIVENRNTNPVSKFFIKVGKYLDSLENFLVELKSNYNKSVEQKKSILESEKADQLLRTHRAKKTAKKVSDKRRLGFNLGKIDDDTLFALAAALGLETADRMGGARRFLNNLFTDKTIHKDVVKKGDFAVQAGTNVVDPPEWIPFPVGTKGLTYTSGFGTRYGRPHQGIDIAGPTGTPIITPVNGMVDVMGSLSGYGKAVYIKSGDLLMEFGHLDSINVKEIGQEVKAGSVIGTLGSTGRSSGPHLHWTIRMNGYAVDPVEWTKSNPPLSSTSHFKATTDLEPLDNESEGGINYHRIMVGEAGPEFVIPMSQMPIFGQLMMEEKIKSINPYYQVPYNRFRDIGFERQSGTGTPMAAGGITENHKTAAKKLTEFFPSAKPIHIAAAMGNFETEAPGLKPDTYQYGGGPGRGIAQWETPGRWDTALSKYGPGVINSLDQQLRFVQWEMNTGHYINGSPNLPWGNAAKSEWLNTFDITAATDHFMRGYEAPGVPHWEQRLDNAEFFLANMPEMLKGKKLPEDKSTPIQPKAKPQSNPVSDLFNYIWNFPGKVKQEVEKKLKDDSVSSRLNSIPDNKQMEIASETQEEFSFGNSKGEIVALYKPTVHYSDPV